MAKPPPVPRWAETATAQAGEALDRAIGEAPWFATDMATVAWGLRRWAGVKSGGATPLGARKDSLLAGPLEWLARMARRLAADPRVAEFWDEDGVYRRLAGHAFLALPHLPPPVPAPTSLRRLWRGQKTTLSWKDGKPFVGLDAPGELGRLTPYLRWLASRTGGEASTRGRRRLEEGDDQEWRTVARKAIAAKARNPSLTWQAIADRSGASLPTLHRWLRLYRAEQAGA